MGRNQRGGEKNILMKPLAVLASLIKILLTAFIISLSGCGQKSNSQTNDLSQAVTLVDSQGQGGWMLFDSDPETYERGHSVALEEGAKVRVTGTVTDGRTPETKLCPVTVLSGKYSGRSGWVAATAVPGASTAPKTNREAASDKAFEAMLKEFRESLRLKAVRSMMAGESPDACRAFVAEQISIYQKQNLSPDQLLQARVCAFNAVWDAVVGFSANSVGMADTDKNHQALLQFQPFCAELQRDKDVQREILFAAAPDANISLINWLLKQGADVNMTSQAGFTPLAYAIQLGKGNDAAKTVQALLDAGADYNRKYYKGMTATMFAAANGNADVLKVLLAKNPDLKVANDEGQTALQMAEAANHVEAAVLLENAGGKE